MGRKSQFTTNAVFERLHEWIVKNGRPPTMEEFRLALGVGSTRTVHRYLQALEQEGRIERWSGARGIRLRKVSAVRQGTQAIPLVGLVSASGLNLAEEHIEAWVRLPEELLRPKNQQHFLLRVHGDSMNRARVENQLIEEGDLILVRQQNVAGDGEIVVAEVDGETTVKRLSKGPDYTVLKPESDNPSHQPIMLARDFAVQGVVTKVIKQGRQYLVD
ncbi:MAG: transcriptional repressor LexA [Candidatus Hydrogenedentes bacterium]|nr:transcriptional repressor LexA [Candidatus Hydrogenedentota bacterium]